MIDPVVTKLTSQLQQKVKELNEIWKQLQENDCYARMEILNNYSSNDLNELQLKSVEQKIQYIDPNLYPDDRGPY
tara:strand:- start:4605 stop:4829 length:225 start_codon:yes stop_codon:yes gene_type:complete